VCPAAETDNYESKPPSLTTTVHIVRQLCRGGKTHMWTPLWYVDALALNYYLC